MPAKTDQPPLPAGGGSYRYDPETHAWVKLEGTVQEGLVSHKTPPAAPATESKEGKE